MRYCSFHKNTELDEESHFDIRFKKNDEKFPVKPAYKKMTRKYLNFSYLQPFASKTTKEL